MIGLVTVNYNQYQLTREFLDSLAKIKHSEKKSIIFFIVKTTKRI